MSHTPARVAILFSGADVDKARFVVATAMKRIALVLWITFSDDISTGRRLRAPRKVGVATVSRGKFPLSFRRRAGAPIAA